MTVFWLICTVALLMLCQVVYYNRWGTDHIRYERYFSRDRVFAGDTLELIEVLTNDKLIPIPWARVESRISPYLRFGHQADLDVNMDRFHKSVFFLGSYKKITRRHRVEATRRGYYDCTLSALTVGDLFGLSTKTTDMSVAAKLFVYPAITPPDALPDEALEWQGDVSVRRWIDPDPILVCGIREYLPGDSQRDVHWAATARTGQLQVKVRDYTISPKLLVLFNSQITENLWAAMEPMQREFLENGVSISAALAAWGSRQGMDVGFRTNGGSKLAPSDKELTVSVDPAPGNLDAVLEAMALLEIKMQLNFSLLLDAEIARRTTNMDILCVSAYWSQELETRAQTLRAMGNSVVHIPITGGEAK